MWNPLGLVFQASKRLDSVLDPSGRDVTAWNSRVLERIGIDFLGKIAKDGQVWDGIGVAMLVLRRMLMNLEKGDRVGNNNLVGKTMSRYRGMNHSC